MQKDYEIIELSNEKRWKEVLNEFEDIDVFYLYEYVYAYTKEIGSDAFLFYAQIDKGKAINCFIINKILKNGRSIITPYGYGGMIVQNLSDNEIERINKLFIDFCKENNIKEEVVRFGLLNNYKEKYYGIIEPVKKNIVRDLNGSINDIIKSFEYKVRKNLKRADESNLKFSIDYTGKTIEDFLKIYYLTMERNNAKIDYYFSKNYIEKLCNMNNSVIFNVLKDTKVISTELVLYDKSNCYSFLGGTLSEFFKDRPNDFLKFNVIKWAKDNNFKNYILGGGYTNKEDDGIYKYKKSFAPSGIYDFYIGKHIFY